MLVSVTNIVDSQARQTRSSVRASLHCPYCGSALEHVLQLQAATHAADADYGVLRCGCSRYPIVEGIPVLQQIEGIDKIVRLIEQKDAARALLQAMNVFRVRWAHRSRWHQARYYLNCRRLVATQDLTFESALDLVRQPKEFADYLFQRYANPSFMSDMALMPLLGSFFDHAAIVQSGTASDLRPRVLDLGCGAGHSSFLMTHWFPGVSVVAADHDFVSLYVAKRFLAPNAEYVCFDSEVPNPFANDCFDAVHCLDAFHYFKSKRAIVSDLKRVVRRSGLWVFAHLHNALMDNVTAGIPLSPEHYYRCFESLDPMLFDEADIRCSLSTGATAERIRARPAAELTGAQTLALVSGGAGTLPGPDGLSALMLQKRSSLRINPIYDGAWHGSTLKLEVKWPNKVLHRECIDAESVLPRTPEIARSDLDVLLNGTDRVDDPLLRDLLRRFVVVPLTPRYGRRDLVASVNRVKSHADSLYCSTV